MIKGEIMLTIEEAARQIGCGRERLRLDLQSKGAKTDRGKKYTLRQVFEALWSDGKAARVRKTQAEAELTEIKAKERVRNLIPKDEVVSFIRQTFAPVREQVLAMPAVLSGKVNPADPEHARAHLEQWRDLFLRQCKEHLPE